MSNLERSTVTRLLESWQGGDAAAFDQLYARLYDQLRAIARRHMSQENPGHTLQATALVHEAYERLAGLEEADWQGRSHFLAVAANVMRRMLVDHARGRSRAKRGGGAVKISLDDVATIADEAQPQLLDLDAALCQLGQQDARKEKVIELHYFGGLTQPQIAEALGISPATVDRDLRMAKAWLKRAMGEP